MTTRLTIVRHGTTVWMEQGLTHGRLDAPLSELGVRQAQAAAAALHGRQFEAFYSSPTGRAWQTAQILAPAVGLQPEPLDLLMEQDFGALEGTPMHRMPAVLMALRMISGWVLPFGRGGETFGAVSRRAKKVLDQLARQHPQGAVLIVSHSGLINTLLRRLTGRLFGFYLIRPASITEVELDGHGRGKILTDIETAFRPKAM